MIENFFDKLSSGDLAISEEHGLVIVLFEDVRNGVSYVTCKTNDENEIEFEATEGEIISPTEWQINTAICSCEARIENGAKVSDSFKWLREEVQKAHKGSFTYDIS